MLHSPPLISAYHLQCIGTSYIRLGAATFTATTSAAWPAANFIYIAPLRLDAPFTVRYVWALNGATANGNFAIGVYTADGAAKLVASASTAQSGTNAIQSIDVTDTLLSPGDYLMALGSDSGTATFFGSSSSVPRGYGVGLMQHASGYSSGLPTSLTRAMATTSARAWVFGISQGSVI